MEELSFETFRQEIELELKENILRFWMTHAPDEQFGGFLGSISNRLVVDQKAYKGLILNARILWAFSRAYRLYTKPDLLRMAHRAYQYLDRFFLDRDFGGFFWTVDFSGRPLDTRKRTYGQAFAIYGLSEYFLATRSPEAADAAIQTFGILEEKAKDNLHGGYFETFEQNWRLADDQRLSPIDQDDCKSMNTHLHVLEAYTALSESLDSSQARNATRDTLMLMIDQIIDLETMHFRLFFDADWRVKSDHISFGHDIEGSWLLGEAAKAVGEADLSAKVDKLTIQMARAVYDEGLDKDGALLYEADPSGVIDFDRHWWPQAEAVVGFLNSYQLTKHQGFKWAAVQCWQFIKRAIIDKTDGEWFWKVSSDGKPDYSRPKVDQWKGPYHNGRMCFEVISRLDPRRIEE
jgi:mannobiose 2-epimerase